MKIFKILLIAAGLLGSIQTMACDVYIHVRNGLINQKTLVDLEVNGPYSRRSDKHDLKSGESFTYHATGSAFSCHGEYFLMAPNLQEDPPYCYIFPSTVKINMSKDGHAYMDIVDKSTKSNKECIIAPVKPSNSLNDSLSCIAIYAQDNRCDSDHWSEINDHCETSSYPAMEKDNFLMNQVKAGNCAWDNWSNLADQIWARE